MACLRNLLDDHNSVRSREGNSEGLNERTYTPSISNMQLQSLKNYACCSSVYMDELSALEHLSAHLRKYTNTRTQYQCNKCDFVSIHRKHIIGHLSITHFGVKPFKCQNCNFSSAWHSSLFYHKKSCSRSFNCSPCSFDTKWEEDLSSHLKKCIKGKRLVAEFSTPINNNIKRKETQSNAVKRKKSKTSISESKTSPVVAEMPPPNQPCSFPTPEMSNDFQSITCVKNTSCCISHKNTACDTQNITDFSVPINTIPNHCISNHQIQHYSSMPFLVTSSKESVTSPVNMNSQNGTTDEEKYFKFISDSLTFID